MNRQEFSRIIERRVDEHSHAPFRGWTPQEIENAVIAMYSNAPNIKADEIPAGFYKAIIKHHVGLKEITAKLGITRTEKKPSYKPVKISEKEILPLVENAIRDGMTAKEAFKEYTGLYRAIKRAYGDVPQFKKVTGIEFLKKQRVSRRNIKHTDEQLSEFVSAVSNICVEITQLHTQVIPPTLKRENTVINREQVDYYVKQALCLDVENINSEVLDGINADLTYSIKQHYGTIVNYFSSIDIDRYKKPYTTFTWTKENIVWQLERWIREGYPVNYTAIQSRHKGIIVASRRIFGSYKKAFEYAQIDYNNHRVDTTMASRYGTEFERIVGEIFTELQLSYEREPTISGCHPDFVFGKHWVDAKLSEWTVSFADCSTIHKYLPNCRRLSIVYLRQMRNETFYTNELGVDMVHVSVILKALPPQRGDYYKEKLNAIITQLETVVA